GWVAENQEDTAFLSRLRSASREWEASARSEDLLWRGQAAIDARRWHERYAEVLAPAEARYLKAMIALSERAQRLRRRLFGSAFAVLAAVAVVVSYLAIRAQDRAAEAQQQARRARDATRMAVAREWQSDPTTALALVREAEQY